MLDDYLKHYGKLKEKLEKSSGSILFHFYFNKKRCVIVQQPRKL